MDKKDDAQNEHSNIAEGEGDLSTKKKLVDNESNKLKSHKLDQVASK